MRRLIRIAEETLHELVLDRERIRQTGTPPPRPPPPEHNDHGGGDPKGGTFWVRGPNRIAITGTTHELGTISGEVVMADPSAFGLSHDEIMNFLKRHPYGEKGYQPADEYQAMLDGKPQGYLWRSSKLVFQMMLQKGWLWVQSTPPAYIHFVVSAEHAKSGIAAASKQFSLMQTDEIILTEVTDFQSIGDRHPHLSKNRTINFSSEDHAGFAGAFGAMMRWLGQGEIPAGNYLYTLVPEGDGLGSVQRDGLSGRPRSVRTADGYNRGAVLKRPAIGFRITPPPAVPEGMMAIRVLRSAAFNGQFLAITEPNRRGECMLYGIHPGGFVHLRPDQIERLTPEGWKRLA